VVGVLRDDDLLALADQVEDRRLRGQTAGEGETAATLQSAERLLAVQVGFV
jgi:hypothetical protein